MHGYLNMLDPGPVGVETDLIGTGGRLRGGGNGAHWELWQPGSSFTRNSVMCEQLFPMPHRVVSFGIRSVQDICACIESGGKPLCSGDDGRAALEIALALRHSQREGNCRVDLPFGDLGAAIRTA